MAINCPNCNTFLRGLEDIDVVDNRCKHCDFDELSIESMAAVMGANKKRYESDIDLDVSSPEIIDSNLTYEPDDEIVELIDDDPRKPMELPSQEIFNDIDKLNSYTRLPIWDVFSDLGLSGSEMRTICKEIEKEWKEDVLYYNEDANRGVLYAKILEPNIENWDINNKKLLIWTNIPSMNENPLETIGESGPWQWGLVEEEEVDDWRRAFLDLEKTNDVFRCERCSELFLSNELDSCCPLPECGGTEFLFNSYRISWNPKRKGFTRIMPFEKQDKILNQKIGFDELQSKFDEIETIIQTNNQEVTSKLHFKSAINSVMLELANMKDRLDNLIRHVNNLLDSNFTKEGESEPKSSIIIESEKEEYVEKDAEPRRKTRGFIPGDFDKKMG